jgi:hypothetical protein
VQRAAEAVVARPQLCMDIIPVVIHDVALGNRPFTPLQ